MGRNYLFLFVIFVLLAQNLYSSSQNIKVYKKDEAIYLSLGIEIKNPKEIYKRLSSGLSSKVLISIQVRDKGKGASAIDRELLFEAIYDVWEEKYRLFVYDPKKRLIVETKDREEIYRQFTSPENILIGDIRSFSEESILNIKVKAVINPVSKDILEKIKGYLSDPESGVKGSPTRTIFGSFANTFIPELNVENAIKYEIKAVKIKDIPVIK